MAKLLKLRRGTTSQHSSFTGAEGEVTIDTDKDTAVVHDGSTAAGRPLAREDLNNVASASITGRLASGSIATAKIADDAINGDKIADNSITSAHNAADTVVAADIAANSVGTSEIAADAVTGAQIADNAINSEHYVDGSIDRVHLAADIIDGTKIADNAIGAEHIAGNAVGSSEIATNAVGQAELAGDAVTGTHIADNAINSEHYVDGSIDNAHIAENAVTGYSIAADTLASSHIPDNIINSEHYADASIDHVHLSNDCVDGDNIANDAINSEHYVDSSIDREHLNCTNSGSNGQALTRNGSQFTWSTISPDGGNAATLDGIDSASFLRSDASDTCSGTINFSGKKIGLGTEPGSGLGARNAAIALGDNDTGIAQNGDGQLELWANNQEVINVSSGDVNIIKNLKYNNGFGSEGTVYGCRMWVAFNGQSEAIYGDGNVSSVGDEGNAHYKVNFSTSLPNTNYCTGGSVIGAASGGYNATVAGWGGVNTAWVKLSVQHVGDQQTEVPRVNVMIHQ